ncbi:MAG: hypothetical protein KatS3mg027_1317 [Bacteroidia bacterium]|nr:MAG: hypothetical protein KatS3mg027_1317 [Bacteroidia bacterium]
MKKLFAYFFQGLVVLVPVIITLYIILKIISIFVDFFVWIGITGNLILDVLIGLVVMVALIVGIGVMASNYFFSNVMQYFENQFEKLPLIRHIYSPIKDFTEAFVGNKKKFKYPVLVQTSPHNAYKEIGFITQQDLSEYGLHDYVAVYLPFSYSFAGRMIFVKKECIEPFSQNPTDTMKFVISGGIYEVEKKSS